MFQFVLRKMLIKKWMLLAILLGNILLIATVAAFPMYTEAVLERTLQNDFQEKLVAENTYPATVTIETEATGEYKKYQDRESLAQSVPETFGLPALMTVRYASLKEGKTTSNYERAERRVTSLALGSLTDLENHIRLVSGTGMTSEPDADGVYDGIVSENCLLQLKLIPGEILTFTRVSMENGEPMRVRIAGVFENSEADDPYWVDAPGKYLGIVFIDADLFQNSFLTDPMPYEVNCKWSTLLDYTAMKADDAESFLTANSAYESTFSGFVTATYDNNAVEMIREFRDTAQRLKMTLLLLQIPMFVLIAAFIFMVAAKTVDMERDEISVIRSRGASRGNIIRIYLIQGLIIECVAMLAGVPLSLLLVRAIGSVNAFLEFVDRSALQVSLSRQTLYYLLAAALFSILVMLWPVVRQSGVTIVAQKRSRQEKHKMPVWQKAGLDYIILAISLYGLYRFNGQKSMLMENMLKGGDPDWFLFACPTLFMLGASLAAVRLIPLLIKLVFLLCKKRLSPALFTSFKQVMFERRESGFIMVFLVMIVALGVFDSVTARTILDMNERELCYQIGADIVLQEVWKDNSATAEEDAQIIYNEPGIEKYTELTDVISSAKVSEEQVSLILPDDSTADAKLMGIDTKEFGETAWFETDLLPTHWYNVLNSIAPVANGLILSSTLQETYGVSVGDTVRIKTADGDKLTGVICAFVDYWPGYEPANDYELIVANLAWLQQSRGVTPYQVWLKTDGDNDALYDLIEEESISFTVFRDSDAECVALRQEALIQGTNGMLTIGYIVLLVLCAAGFLIYWSLSIRSRQLQFGIFRAMGMYMREIVTMLLNEQFWISGCTVAFGFGLGLAAVSLFMPLTQIMFLTSGDGLPLRIIVEQSDIVRLAAIIAVTMLLCFAVLIRLILRIRIAQALKLGED